MFTSLAALNDMLHHFAEGLPAVLAQLDPAGQQQLRTDWLALPATLHQPGDLDTLNYRLTTLLDKAPVLREFLPPPSNVPHLTRIQLDPDEEIPAFPDGDPLRLVPNEVVRPTQEAIRHIAQQLQAHVPFSHLG